MTVSGRPAELWQTTIAFVALLCMVTVGLALRAGSSVPVLLGAEEQFLESQADAPLTFVPNRGQGPAGTRFYAQGAGYALGLGPRRATLALEQEGRGHVLGLRFAGANPDPVIEARRRAPGTVSHLGRNAGAAQGLPVYREVVYRDLWPRIDMAFEGTAGRLKYTFHVAPGADVSDIRLAYEGATRTALTSGGDLLVHTPLGALRDPRPRSHQRAGGRRVPLESAYAPAAGGGYGIAVTGHDPRRALVIDPGLVYGTYLGGAEADQAHALAIDGEGNAYVAGRSSSSDFPTTPGAYDPDSRPGMAFVTKLDPTGSALVYSTVIGAGETGFALALGIDVDSEGAAYLTGTTTQSGFPTTPGAFDTTFDGGSVFAPVDGWAAKLSPDGSRLAYSTFLGGSAFEEATDVAVDAAGHAHVTGHTGSPNFPLTPGAADTTLGLSDGFVTKLTPNGSALAYSTFLGGSSTESIEGEVGNVAIHAGRAFVTGTTVSADFPTTEGVHDRTHAGCYDVFVTELNTAGTEFLRSTLAGGASCDYPLGIAVDREGNPYVAGHTDSTDFPTTPDAFDSSFNGAFGDGYALKLDGDTFQLGYSTYIGGSRTDNFEVYGDVDVDARGRAYLTGVTQSPDYPLTPDAVASPGGIFLTKVSPDGTFLDYSTLLGNANGTGVAVDERGTAYIAGTGFAAGVQTTPGAFDTTFNDGSNTFSADAFVQKVDTTRDCTVDAKGRLATNKRARLDLRATIGSDDPQPRGKVRYHDVDARLLLRTGTITSLVAGNGHATLRGSARIRGQDVIFRIDLDERSGPSPQHVRIELSNGYGADDELKGRIEIDCA